MTAFCPWPLEACLSEIGMFPSGREQSPELGSQTLGFSSHFVWSAPPSPKPGDRGQEEPAGHRGCVTGTADCRQLPSTPMSEGPVILSVPKTQAESYSDPPQPPWRRQKPKSPAGQAATGGSAQGAGCLSAQLCPHRPWALPDKPAHTTQAQDKGALEE